VDFLSWYWIVVTATVGGMFTLILTNTVTSHYLNAAANGIHP